MNHLSYIMFSAVGFTAAVPIAFAQQQDAPLFPTVQPTTLPTTVDGPDMFSAFVALFNIFFWMLLVFFVLNIVFIALTKAHNKKERMLRSGQVFVLVAATLLSLGWLPIIFARIFLGGFLLTDAELTRIAFEIRQILVLVFLIGGIVTVFIRKKWPRCTHWLTIVGLLLILTAFFSGFIVNERLLSLHRVLQILF